ncbi:MAG: Tn3 family transposase, partial [Gammaproteobacteria bacterium]
MYHVREFSDGAKKAARQRVYEQQTEASQNLQKAGEVLRLFTEDGIGDTTPFREAREKAFGILEREKLAAVADRIAAEAGFDETAYEWEEIDRMGRQFKYHLRPVLQAVDFTAVSARGALMKAAAFLREAFRKGRSLSQYPSEAFPVAFIPESAKRYLYAKDGRGKKRPIPYRYEFLVYRQLKDGLEVMDISCRDSVRFRSFEDDLVNRGLWERDKERLIADTGLAILRTPIREHLAEFKERVETRLAEVNRRILSGENEHFKIHRRGKDTRWTLRDLPASEPVNQPVFEALGQTDIADVLRFVHRECGFLGAFDHVLGRYAKQDPDNDILIACLIAWATNLWLWQMGEISDIPFHILASVSDNFIRPETLKTASDIICNAIAKLSSFRQYDLDKRLHSSSDGQKFETKIDTVNARHSPKYFGLGKGIVSNNLVINHVSPNAKIIGANEHESRYLYDLLKSNTTDIVPEIHSTDSHGINAVNFAILNISGYQFAPRYKDIREKVGTSLYGFQHPTKYDEDWLLRPVRKINED